MNRMQYHALQRTNNWHNTAAYIEITDTQNILEEMTLTRYSVTILMHLNCYLEKHTHTVQLDKIT